jgi:Tfp pilus assembly PilM family ATPase
MADIRNLFSFGKKSKVSETSDIIENLTTPEVESITKVQAPEDYVYIAVTSTHINLLQVNTSLHDFGRILWSEEIALGPYESVIAGQPVQNLLYVLPKALNDLKFRIEGQHHVSVSIPSDDVFFKNIHIPNTPDKDKMIAAEIKKYLPIPMSDIFFATNGLESHDSQLNLFAVALPKKTLEGYREVFKNFGVNSYFEIEIFSLARLLPVSDKFEVLVYVAPLVTYLVFTKNGQVYDVKNIPHGEVTFLQNISKVSGLGFEEVHFIRDNAKNLNKNKLQTGVWLQKEKEKFVENLNVEIVHRVMEFEALYSEHVQTILYAAPVDLERELGLALQTEIDKDVKIISLANMSPKDLGLSSSENKPLSRYTQCFGLAKRKN